MHEVLTTLSGGNAVKGGVLRKGFFIYYHIMAYSDLLKDPRWQKKRLEVFEKDNFACFFCGETKETLHVHHFRYSGDPWDAPLSDLCTLCESCHEVEHLKSKMGPLERDLYDLIMTRAMPVSNGDNEAARELMRLAKGRIKLFLNRG